MSNADFAAAQERVAARRRQRQAASQAQLDRQRESYERAAQENLPRPLQNAWVHAKLQWDTISGRGGTRPAFRVGQVDAELLDEELLGLLKGQVGEALKYLGRNLRDDWSAEILLALRAILFKFSVWDHDASYGAALQNLHYTDARDTTLAYKAPARWQKTLYGLISVGGRYAWTKWEDYLLDVEGGYDEPSPRILNLSRLSNTLSTAHSVAALGSFIVFLLNGKYRTILDRIVRLRLAPKTSQVSREVSFEYLNRQLVWHAFTEFLLFILPLVGISRWRRWLARAWRRASQLVKRPGNEDEGILKTGGELGFLPERTCAICYQDQNPTSAADNEIAAVSGTSSGVVGSAQTDVTNPYEAIPCGCVYDFVCLAQRLEAEDSEGWTCLRCGSVIRACKPWSGDVIEQSRPSSKRKSVSFAEEEDMSSFKILDPLPMEDESLQEMERADNDSPARLSPDPTSESLEWSEVNSGGHLDGGPDSVPG